MSDSHKHSPFFGIFSSFYGKFLPSTPQILASVYFLLNVLIFYFMATRMGWSSRGLYLSGRRMIAWGNHSPSPCRVVDILHDLDVTVDVVLVLVLLKDLDLHRHQGVLYAFGCLGYLILPLESALLVILVLFSSSSFYDCPQSVSNFLSFQYLPFCVR